MFEGRMRSTGWGVIGSTKKGFEWLFTPEDKGCFGCRSGYVFKTEAAAIRDGRKWQKETGRIGTITAVEAEPAHFGY